METTVPATYDMSNHGMSAAAQRRMLVANAGQSMPFYSNPPMAYTAPFQPPSYGFAHSLNNHPTSYQQFFGSGPPVHQHPHPHPHPQQAHPQQHPQQPQHQPQN